MTLDETGEDGGNDGGGWLATFADLMALLMCFFVLLLSFSEIEASKYKQVAGSMKNAFGVQREIKTKEIPKGTSIIAQEFSPGKPTRTFAIVLQQSTTDQYKANLDFSDSDYKGKESEDVEAREVTEAPKDEAPEQQLDQSIIDAAKMIAKALKPEIDDGLIEIFATPELVSIRVRENGSFASGSADLRAGFKPVLERITKTLNRTRGEVVVEGHTDDVPIATARFPTNWELSAGRAAAFVHFMTDQGRMRPDRLQIRAYGDVRPLVANNSSANRAKNRRVEIALVLPPDQVARASAALAESGASETVSQPSLPEDEVVP